MFLVAVLQGVKIADLTKSSQRITSDDMGDTIMTSIEDRLPGGTEAEQVLDRAEERALVRDSTAGFAGKTLSMSFGWKKTSDIPSRLGRKLF
jgi:proteasome activator subunit 4